MSEDLDAWCLFHFSKFELVFKPSISAVGASVIYNKPHINQNPTCDSCLAKFSNATLIGLPAESWCADRWQRVAFILKE